MIKTILIFIMFCAFVASLKPAKTNNIIEVTR